MTIGLGKKATPGLITETEPDVIVVATGSVPMIPDISGVERTSVVTAVDLLLAKIEPHEPIVVIGGGLIGCETALHLAQKGSPVTIVEMLNHIAHDSPLPNQMHLRKLLADAHVRILTKANASAIVDKGVLVCCGDAEGIFLEANSGVLAVGIKSDRELYKALKNRFQSIYAVGDCVSPRKVLHAIWEAFRIALLI